MTSRVWRPETREGVRRVELAFDQCAPLALQRREFARKAGVDSRLGNDGLECLEGGFDLRALGRELRCHRAITGKRGCGHAAMLLERHDQRVEIGQHLGAAQFTLLDPVGTDPVRHQHAQQV